jgi:ATP-binding cassette subfamily C protein/ATP-binding cassette subfamily C protein LapB
MSVSEAVAQPFIPLSEELAQALRDGDRRHFSRCSPHAACLLALLKSLGWNHCVRELLEALPHFSESFELIELRNVLVSLGYENTEVRIPANQLDPELLPCLYVSSARRPYILLEITDRGIRYFDAERDEER